MTAYIKKIAMPVLGVTMAASLALSPIAATPARADDTGAALAAGGIIALITAGIIASEASRGHLTVTTRAPEPYRPTFTPPTPRRPAYIPPAPRRPAYVPPAPRRGTDAKVLPRRCAETARAGNGRNVTVYSKACLLREMPRWTFLPDRCETRTRGQGGRVKVFAANCLARYGFTPETRGARR